MSLSHARTFRLFLLGTLLSVFTAPAAAEEPGLAILMQRMQTYTHKLQLSITARNAPLADFYLHELEETAEFVIDNIPTYDDYPVGELTREMLLPAVERLEDAVKSGEWTASDQRFSETVAACNACHQVAGHGYVRIVPADANPFAQDFSVAED